MGVNAQITDERGAVFAEVLYSRHVIPGILRLPAVEGTACLCFIDPFGDTVFTRLQMPALIG